MVSLPNALTCVRFVALPFLLAAAACGKRGLFIGLLALAWLTDMLDGYVARKLNQTTGKGALLDSWADFGLYLTLLIGIRLLWPETVSAEAPFVTLAACSYFVPVGVGLLKYRGFPSHHTWGAKIGALLLAGSLASLLAGVSPWPLRVCAPLFLLAGIEDILVTLILPSPRSDARHVFHAWKLRREMLAAARGAGRATE